MTFTDSRQLIQPLASSHQGYHVLNFQHFLFMFSVMFNLDYDRILQFGRSGMLQDTKNESLQNILLLQVSKAVVNGEIKHRIALKRGKEAVQGMTFYMLRQVMLMLGTIGRCSLLQIASLECAIESLNERIHKKNKGYIAYSTSFCLICTSQIFQFA